MEPAERVAVLGQGLVETAGKAVKGKVDPKAVSDKEAVKAEVPAAGNKVAVELERAAPATATVKKSPPPSCS